MWAWWSECLGNARRRASGVAVSAVLALYAAAAHAETDIRFQLPPMPEGLQTAIINGSLLADAVRTEKTDVQELFADANADYQRILSILYSNGYYGAVVNIFVDGREAALIPPLDAPDSIGQIIARVYPGPLYRLSETEINPLAPGTSLPPGFVTNEAARTGVIRGAGTATVEGWRNAGHAKAEITDQQIIARHDEREVDVRVAVDPGPLLRFGQIDVAGEEDVRAQRILTIAGLEEGGQFDPAEIAEAEARLRRTGSFSSVRLAEAPEPTEDNLLPMTIEVVEQTPRRFGFGAEYSNVEGGRLSAFWLHRNLLGGAERFRVDGEIAGIGGFTGGVDYTFGTRYERPATPRADTDLFIDFELELLDEPTFRADTAEFTVGFTRFATENLVVDFGVGLVYSATVDDLGDREFLWATLPLGATYDRRRNPLNPKDGYFVDLELTPFYGIEGTTNGLLTEADLRGYESFGATERLTFAARIQIGSLVGPDLLESPPTYLFRSGGGGTVRGQDYESLGVVVDGNELGGRSFFGTSLELRTGVTEAIELVAFYDYGYVGEEEFPDFSGDSHSGAGLGFRYNTGIGPIRLDVATPVSGSTEASDFYLYIGIGQAF